MEGGPWDYGLRTETHQFVRLRAKIRLYSMIYDELVVSAGDYLQSRKLCWVVDNDRPLWERGGPMRIALPDQVSTMSEYIQDLAFDPKRAPIWVGKTDYADTPDIRAKEGIDKKATKVLNTELLRFDYGQARDNFKVRAVEIAKRQGLLKLADDISLRKDDPFNRDTLQKCTSELPEKDRIEYLQTMNVYYYLNGASVFGSDCAAQPQYHKKFRQEFSIATDPPLPDLLARMPRESRNHLRFLEQRLREIFLVMGVDFKTVTSLHPDKFANIVGSRDAIAFRKKLWKNLAKAMMSVDYEQLCANELKEQFDDIWKDLAATQGRIEKAIKQYRSMVCRALGVGVPVIRAFTVWMLMNGLLEIQDFSKTNLELGAVNAADRLMQFLLGKQEVFSAFTDQFRMA